MSKTATSQPIAVSSTRFPIIQVKNLPYKYNTDEIFEIFGKFGNIQEVRTSASTGQAIIVYQNFKSAVLAVEKMSGFNYSGRFLTVKLFIPEQSKVNELIQNIRSA